MVSATQLSSFLYCPRKLFMSNILLLEEPPKEELVKGTVWHKTYEWIHKHEEKIVKSLKTPNYGDIADIYRREFAKELRNSIIAQKSALNKFDIKPTDLFKEYWEHFDEEAKVRAWNVASFMMKHRVFGDELWQKLSPKILSEQYFRSESLNLSGIIDMIEVHDDRTYVPVELKSGKVPEGHNAMWPGHRVQLAAYLMLLEDSGKIATEGVLKYKGDEEKRVLVMNSMLKNEVLDLINKVKLLLGRLQLPPRIDNMKKCDKCSFKEKCYNDETMKKMMEEARAKAEKPAG
jgi:CRISPR-associated protein Cas4